MTTQKQCPRCGGFKFVRNHYTNRKTNKKMYWYKRDSIRKHLLFMIPMSIIMLLIEVWLLIKNPKIGNPPLPTHSLWIGIGIALPIVTWLVLSLINLIGELTFTFVGEFAFIFVDLHIIFWPEYFLIAAIFIGSALLETNYGIGKQLMTLVLVILFVGAVTQLRKLGKSWILFYKCELCGFEFSSEAETRFNEIQDNPQLRELGHKNLERKRQEEERQRRLFD